MEWAFADPAKVRQDINDIILRALLLLQPAQTYQGFRGGERIPVVSLIADKASEGEAPAAHQFTTLRFADSIAMYGTDKPDLRIPGRVGASFFSAEDTS